MNTELVQNLRNKLQRRIRRLNAVSQHHFHSTLRQFWAFLHGQPILLGIIDQLLPRFPDLGTLVEKQTKSREVVACDDECQNAAFAYMVLRKCVESDHFNAEVLIGLNLTYERSEDSGLKAFRTAFVEPLHEYLDEQMDDQRAILALLRRYKHKCESFQRRHLFDLWNGNTAKGEELLAFHLYEYLHDQGVNLTIEPYSESGRVDMVAAQNSDDPLIADAKIFNTEKDKGKPYICHGFHQIYQYTLDYNEPFGYLVIFKTCPEDLKFALAGHEQSVPFLTHNHKTIFLLTIDIFPHEKPASKRGYLKSVEITQDDLVRSVPLSNGASEASKPTNP
jgi:hypothetical protein